MQHNTDGWGFNQDRKTIDVAGRYTTFYKRNIERFAVNLLSSVCEKWYTMESKTTNETENDIYSMR